ncbi:hypothetical protein [Paenibacillus jiagnxiensis]|uniref:hypothetical protein n=1 Tax=Paenibacillus jiagnxiensis TaxID=3228926 RepID=UPI0033BE4466
MVDIWEIDDWVEIAATLPIKRFYPSAVAKATGIPLDQVFNRLLHLVKGEALILLYEIRCPEYDCVRTVGTIENLNTVDYLGHCGIHGSFELSPDSIFPVFEFNPIYKERIRAKKKGKTDLH